MKISYLAGIFISLLSCSAAAINFKAQIYDHQQKPLANIVLYLEPLDKKTPLNTATKASDIGQINRAFTPYISVVQKGSKVNFTNQDDITHQIYSPIGQNKFSFKIRAGQQHLMPAFSDSGDIAMGCNIHDWMSGYLLVVDTPYFAKSDAQGQIEINVAHQGKYKATLWHPQLAEPDNRLSQELDIQQDSTIDMHLKQALKPIPIQKSDDDFDFLSDY